MKKRDRVKTGMTLREGGENGESLGKDCDGAIGEKEVGG